MRRRGLLALAVSVSALRPLAVFAQQPRVPVIGFLSSQSPDGYARYVSAFRKGLEAAGYIENRNVIIEYRWAAGQLDVLPALASDLARHQVAVIAATGGLASARAAQAATATIPIVFNLGGDPVAAGLVPSFSRPGGNITGVSWFSDELNGKRLGLLHELVPSAAVIGLLINRSDPENADIPKEAAEIARVIGVRVVVLAASTPREIDAAFSQAVQNRINALAIAPGAFFVSNRAQIVALAAHHAIPTIHSARTAVEEGGLMFYGNDLADAYRLNGTYIGRILKGDRASDLPVQRADKFELVINLKTAKDLGITVPQALLQRADDVIE